LLQLIIQFKSNKKKIFLTLSTNKFIRSVLYHISPNILKVVRRFELYSRRTKKEPQIRGPKINFYFFIPNLVVYIKLETKSKNAL